MSLTANGEIGGLGLGSRQRRHTARGTSLRTAQREAS